MCTYIHSIHTILRIYVYSVLLPPVHLPTVLSKDEKSLMKHVIEIKNSNKNVTFQMLFSVDMNKNNSKD